MRTADDACTRSIVTRYRPDPEAWLVGGKVTVDMDG